MKHIESIQPEYAASDLSRLLVSESDATASAALTALLHSVTGCAIPPTADTPQSEVEELVPLCLSILRRHWTTPLTALGDGTTPMSLADLMRRLILGRVDGNESLGIPPANANIPTAVSQLLDRKIGGVPQAPDGISLVQLLTITEANDSVTELVDDNRGWVMTKRFSAKTYLPNCEKVELGCEDIDVTFDYNGGTVFGSDVEYHLPNLKVIHPETINVGFGHGVFDCAVQTHDIYMPELERIESGSNFAIIRGISAPNNTEPFSLYAPKLSSFGSGVSILRRYNACTTGVERIILGTITTALTFNANYGGYMDCPNLVHLEFGQGTKASLNLAGWSPTTALSERLPEFLSNFKTYIAQRLTDHGSGLTLTLSQAVYESIWDADGNPLDNPICQAIDEIMTNKKWDINKA